MHINQFLAFGVSVLCLLQGVSSSPQRQGSRQTNTQEGQTVSITATGRTSKATSTADGNNSNQADLALDPDNVQTGSQSDGDPQATAGQAASLTDDANFINFCSGKTLTNGQQIVGGSCNGIVMGDIPSQKQMISSIITNPAPGEDIAADTDFDINVQVDNLQAGTFTNPDNTYYAAPQQLKGGQVVGHTHVTVQSLGNSIVATNPPDAGTFVFFKGINDAGNGNGGLSATVTGGLPAGAYRVCTMTSSSNHQPVLMPVAQRGAQDDCTKFTVGGTGGNNNASGGNSSNTGKNVNGDDSAASSSIVTSNTTITNKFTKANATSSAKAAAATSTATTDQRGRNQSGQGRRNRFAVRDFIV